jgi:DNA polymerase (family 10)
MTNAEMAAVFREVAGLLRRKKENIFKIRSYERVADSIDALEEDVEALAAQGKLREIAGAGEAITKKITEMAATGRLTYLERLKSEVEENGAG